MAVAIDIKVNVKELARDLRGVQRKQIPFATANTLTSLAFEARKEVVDRLFVRAFNVKNKRFPGVAFRVMKATKRRLVASVFDRLQRADLMLHATGGTKSPRRSNRLAIPSRQIKRTKSGKISKARTPTAVRDRGAFVARMRSGKEGIWQRHGRRGSKLRLLYHFERAVRIARRFRFFEGVQTLVRRRSRPVWDREIAKALATARPAGGRRGR